MTYIESAVTIADVAKATKATPTDTEAEARALDIFVGVDWANRPAVATDDAHALVTGAARRTHDHDGAWRLHVDATEAWERGREDARRRAAQTKHDELVRAGHGAPSAGHEAQLAGSAAAEAFEETNPAPTFGGNTSITSWFSQATNRLKEVVR